MVRSLAALVLLTATGCATASQYGNYVNGKDQAQAAMAVDAANKLQEDYPPQEHVLVLYGGEEPDAFGTDLQNQLRKRGFTVRAGGSSDGAIVIRYAVDVIKGTSLLRITLYVDARRLSRAYNEKGQGVEPAGPWSSIGGSES